MYGLVPNIVAHDTSLSMPEMASNNRSLTLGTYGHSDCIHSVRHLLVSAVARVCRISRGNRYGASLHYHIYCPTTTDVRWSKPAKENMHIIVRTYNRLWEPSIAMGSKWNKDCWSFIFKMYIHDNIWTPITPDLRY